MRNHLLLLRNNKVDRLKHAVDAGYHVAGRETDDTKIVFVQPRGTSRIMKRLRVLVAINFDHQSNREAAEVGEIWSERKLATEAMPMDRFAPKIVPQLMLRIRCLSAQLT